MSKDGGSWQLAYDGSVRPTELEHKFEDLTPGSLYAFKVWTRNALGYSHDASPVLEVYAATYPFKMDPPTQVEVTPNSLESSITLGWTAIEAHNGGLPVLGYYLQKNQGYDT